MNPNKFRSDNYEKSIENIKYLSEINEFVLVIG